jgi:hypothetical protein
MARSAAFFLAHRSAPGTHSFPALCRVGVRLNDVLLGPRPSLPRLRRRSLFFVRLVHRYYGAVRLLQSVRVRRVALGLRGPASFPFESRRSRGLPVLVHVVSQRARVLRLRRTVCSLASIANQPWCLPLIRRESASWFCVFRSSIARPADTPVYASSDISRCRPQDSGPRWSRCLLSCRTLSFLTTCRFIPAHPDKRCQLNRSMQHHLISGSATPSSEELICLAVLSQNLAWVTFRLI